MSLGCPLTPELLGPNIICCVLHKSIKAAWRGLLTCSCCSSLVFPSHSLVFALCWFSCFCCWCNRSAFCLFSSCLENWPAETQRHQQGDQLHTRKIYTDIYRSQHLKWIKNSSYMSWDKNTFWFLGQLWWKILIHVKCWHIYTILTKVLAPLL